MMNNREREEASGPAGENAFLYIVCPCNCGRALAVEYTSHSGDVSEFGNKIWRQLACENGLEGAIEYLHENTESNSFSD